MQGTPGVDVTSNEGFFRIRGFGAQAAVDGLSIGNFVGRTGADLTACEQVEILKGPAALFRDNGARGGTVHDNFKRPVIRNPFQYRPGVLGIQFAVVDDALNPHGRRLNGEKFYTTGSLYADWIDVVATDKAGQAIFALVRRDGAGVTVLDDWDGFGQKLSASGTARFSDVEVAPGDLLIWDERFCYAPRFYQIYYLASLVGIGRALVRDTVAELCKHRRGITHALTPLPRHDGQVLQVVGETAFAGMPSRPLS